MTDKMLGPERLTFVLTDSGPLRHLNDPPQHRSVSIKLSHEQREQVGLRRTDSVAATDYYETVAMVFVEQEDTP